ncbi:hypothetical protein HDV00_007167 [Rhizophlyctis rosea]|nr:hypothetical protein HDV00_007167 [Rhizophlyctis rosea]
MSNTNDRVREQVEAETGLSMPDLNTVNVVLKIGNVFDEDSSNRLPQGDRAKYLLFLELGTLLETIAPFYPPQYPQEYREAILQASRKGYQYEEVPSIVFARTNPRYEAYLGGGWNTIARHFSDWAAEATFRMGYDTITSSYEVLNGMQNNDTIAQFLSLLTTMLVILLCALSCFLIYNLLMVSVETRVFDLGVLRMVGQQRWQTIASLNFQAMTYSLPAWVIGLSLAQLLFAGGKTFADKLLHMTLGSLLSPLAIGIATVLGLVVPLISAVLPIRKALSANLRDSLDKRHSKVKATVTTIERSSRGSLKEGLPYAIAGILMTGLGFIIYYLLPLSLVTGNTELMFNIFIGLLVGMLVGLVMFATNMQPLMERLLLRIIFIVLFWESRALRTLVRKNLLAHRLRNANTATMFSFALGFLIFLSVSFSIQLNGMKYDTMHKIGGNIKVASEDTNSQGNMQPMTNVQKLSAICNASRPFVTDWAFTSWGILYIADSVQQTQLMNVGKIARYPINVVGVTPNFFNLPSPGARLLVQEERNPGLNASMSMTEQLYTPEGQQAAILSSFLKPALGLSWSDGTNFSQPILLQTTTDNATNTNFIQPLGFVDAAPYVSMTNFPTTRRTAILVSFQTWVKLTNGLIKSVKDVPIKTMHIAVDPDAANYDQQLTDLVNKLSDACYGTSSTVTNLKHELEGYTKAEGIVSLVFVGTMLLVMFIALLSLSMCMLANIFEQSKEIGVLRALGDFLG